MTNISSSGSPTGTSEGSLPFSDPGDTPCERRQCLAQIFKDAMQPLQGQLPSEQLGTDSACDVYALTDSSGRSVVVKPSLGDLRNAPFAETLLDLIGFSRMVPTSTTGVAARTTSRSDLGVAYSMARDPKTEREYLYLPGRGIPISDGKIPDGISSMRAPIAVKLAKPMKPGVESPLLVFDSEADQTDTDDEFFTGDKFFEVHRKPVSTAGLSHFMTVYAYDDDYYTTPLGLDPADPSVFMLYSAEDQEESFDYSDLEANNESEDEALQPWSLRTALGQSYGDSDDEEYDSRYSFTDSEDETKDEFDFGRAKCDAYTPEEDKLFIRDNGTKVEVIDVGENRYQIASNDEAYAHEYKLYETIGSQPQRYLVPANSSLLGVADTFYIVTDCRGVDEEIAIDLDTANATFKATIEDEDLAKTHKLVRNAEDPSIYYLVKPNALVSLIDHENSKSTDGAKTRKTKFLVLAQSTGSKLAIPVGAPDEVSTSEYRTRTVKRHGLNHQVSLAESSEDHQLYKVAGQNITCLIQEFLEGLYIGDDGRGNSLDITTATSDQLTEFYDQVDPDSFADAMIAFALFRPQDGKIVSLDQANVVFQRQDNGLLRIWLIDAGEWFPTSNAYSEDRELTESREGTLHAVRNGLMGFKLARAKLEGDTKAKAIAKLRKVTDKQEQQARLWDDQIRTGDMTHRQKEKYFEILGAIKEFADRAEQSDAFTWEEFFFTLFPEYKLQWDIITGSDVTAEVCASIIGAWPEEKIISRYGPKARPRGAQDIH